MKLRSTKNAEETVQTNRVAPSGDGSVIAVGTVVTGDCRAPGKLRIDGRVTGNVGAQQLTVGPDGRVDGSVTGPDGGPAEGGVFIEGQVAGAVQGPRVEIGPRGSVGGGLDVGEAVVRGRVRGEVVARKRLVLEETAVVEGDVTAGILGVREGGQVHGTIRIGRPAEQSAMPSGKGGARERAAERGEGGPNERGDAEPVKEAGPA